MSEKPGTLALETRCILSLQSHFKAPRFEGIVLLSRWSTIDTIGVEYRC